MAVAHRHVVAHLASAALFTTFRALAALEPGSPFVDHAVLQRGMSAPVWGKAAPGAEVTVDFAGQSKACRADADGNWRVSLDPMEASREGRELRISACSGGCEETVSADDVLVGEVWLASGQSNMEVPIWGDDPRFRDAKGAMMCAMTHLPLVRYVKTPLAWSVKPRKVQVRWHPLTAESLGKSEKPSAVAFYYARELFLALGVPVGVVDSTWGGTPIDAWTPRSGYDGCDESIRKFADYPVKEKFERPRDVLRPVVYGAPHQPTVLFNGMVAAYAPMAVRGFIWYQGCNNGKEPHLYLEKMRALYRGWRTEFRNPSLKMYFAQLAPFRQYWRGICEAQTAFAEEEPNAAVAVTADVGNFYDIHPNRKELVAQRLAIHALKRDYGFPVGEDDSPVWKAVSSANGVVTLSFAHVRRWYVYSPDRSRAAPFELCGADGKWHSAEILNFDCGEGGNQASGAYAISSPEIRLASEAVRDPKAIRYLADAKATAFLYNEASLPLGPFDASLSR